MDMLITNIEGNLDQYDDHDIRFSTARKVQSYLLDSLNTASGVFPFVRKSQKIEMTCIALRKDRCSTLQLPRLGLSHTFWNPKLYHIMHGRKGVLSRGFGRKDAHDRGEYRQREDEDCQDGDGCPVFYGKFFFLFYVEAVGTGHRRNRPFRAISWRSVLNLN